VVVNAGTLSREAVFVLVKGSGRKLATEASLLYRRAAAEILNFFQDVSFEFFLSIATQLMLPFDFLAELQHLRPYGVITT
jgi:hypothetical protein